MAPGSRVWAWSRPMAHLPTTIDTDIVKLAGTALDLACHAMAGLDQSRTANEHVAAEGLLQVPVPRPMGCPWEAVVLRPVLGLAGPSQHNHLEIARCSAAALNETWNAESVGWSEKPAVGPHAGGVVEIDVPEALGIGSVDKFVISIEGALNDRGMI